MILAGDIGGTKTDVAVFREAGGGLESLHELRYGSGDHESFEEILLDFLQPRPDLEIEAACFGVAGPVFDGACDATNLPWHLEEGLLARCLGVARVKLLNDVEAAAYGMLHLAEEELVVLNPGSGGQGNAAVVAAGTGLGEAILYWDGEQHHAIATEGGHADFSPHTEGEMELLGFLRDRYGGHVSAERVLSGPGLWAIYTFLRESSGSAEPEWLRDELRLGDPPAVIARAGLAGEDAVCAEALEMFAHAYGVEAGNLALKCLARGGVFLGGGMAPRILPALQSGAFLRGFTDKGRFTDLLRDVRVSVALNRRTGLLGAAHFAARLSRGAPRHG